METKRIKIKVDCDLTYTGLSCATAQFLDEFKCLPETLICSIEGIFVALQIEKAKEVLQLKWFRCDRDFKEYHWELESNDYKKGFRYILYSDGA